MSLKSLAAAVAVLMFAGSVAAQETPAPAPAPAQEAPAPAPAEQAPAPAPVPSEEASPPAPAPAAEPAAAPTPPQPKAVPAVPPALTPEDTWVLDLSDGGRVTIQLRPDAAPNHVERIKTLTRRGFYNGLTFHRVIEGFMAQGGDPKGDGTGGSDLPDLKQEFNTLPHVRGAVAAARASSVDSANSQFFIMLMPRFALDTKYTVFGRVVSGMQYVDAIEKGEPPVNRTRIIRASIGSDNVPPPSPAEMAAPPPAPSVTTPATPPAQPQPTGSEPKG